MAYIYKKTAGNNTYYYLRASEKKGNKAIVKDIAYLGKTIQEVKAALDKLPKHKKAIRKAYRTLHRFIESNHYLEKAAAEKLKQDDFLGDATNALEACKLHYNSEFIKNNEITKKETYKNFLIEFAFNTASIEGNTITLKEAKNLLEEGKTPKDKTLREIYDLQNTENVFFELLTSTNELSHEFIIKVHSRLMKNIDARLGYRTTDVRVFKASFESTPAPYVKTDMDILLNWYKKNKDLHPLALATIFHHKFEKIHPFMDGNGRTGRMLLNYILMRNKYPPVIIHRKFRKKYIAALRSADDVDINKINKEYAALIKFVAKELADNYWAIFL